MRAFLTGALLAALAAHSDFIGSIAFSPDRNEIAAASGDKFERIWEAHVGASVAAQMLWSASAEIDPVPDVDRAQLRLASDCQARSTQRCANPSWARGASKGASCR